MSTMTLQPPLVLHRNWQSLNEATVAQCRLVPGEGPCAYELKDSVTAEAVITGNVAP